MSNGSLSGNVSFDATVLICRDFNRAAFITVFGVARTTVTNGLTFDKILFGPG